MSMFGKKDSAKKHNETVLQKAMRNVGPNPHLGADNRWDEMEANLASTLESTVADVDSLKASIPSRPPEVIFHKHTEINSPKEPEIDPRTLLAETESGYLQQRLDTLTGIRATSQKVIDENIAYCSQLDRVIAGLSTAITLINKDKPNAEED